MKLKKIVKHLDNFVRVELIETIHKEEFTCWSGDMLLLQVAAGTKKDREQFLKECFEDEDAEAIAKVEAAMRYIDWYLDTTIDGEAISFTVKKNSYGVDIPHLIIYIKKEK